MDVETISMPTVDAQTAYWAYRESIEKRGQTDEYLRVMAGYKALADGKKLLDLHQAMQKAGLDSEGRPRLAFGRADWDWISFQPNYYAAWNDIRPCFGKWPWPQRGRHPMKLLPSSLFGNKLTKSHWRAMVPLVPPALRPGKTQLKRYHILWEAEWQNVPPRDPFLLKHLADTLYVVLGAWDLTELERAVMGLRVTR